MKQVFQRILQEIMKEIILGTSDACINIETAHQATFIR